MLDVSRRELKYLLSLEQEVRLEGVLEQTMKNDVHGGGEGYMVRSLYFDSLFDTDFEEKVNGYENRRKIRLRIYDPEDIVLKLELKEKEGNTQRKRSLSLTRAEAEQMLEGEYGFLMERAEPLAHRLYTFMEIRQYRPKCVVEYDRRAFYAEENDIRVTFDKNLRATEADFDIFNPQLGLYPVSEAGEVTMEVKYNGFLFSYIKQLVSQADREQVSNSKYCRARMISKKGRR